VKKKLESILPGNGTETSSQPRYAAKPKGSWRKLIGRTKEDDLSPEAFRLGAKWRAQMNRRGR
jgi:hypothetical protein